MNLLLKSFLLGFCLCFTLSLHAQLEGDCKLKFGTNLGGVVDFGTELPFVDLMRNAREWYTKDIDNPADPFDSGFAAELNYRSDGYPTHIPQIVGSADFAQRVSTIWGITTGWPAGQYTVLWEGTGELSFWGGFTNLQETHSHRMTFDFYETDDSIIEMTIVESDIDDPIRNVRVLMPGTEMTYEEEPFYDLWIERLSIFPSVRFMDWGQTNNWGQTDAWSWDDPSLFSWEERAQMNHYTWATSKGIPYEMQVKLLNDYDLDGWVCVPHRANDEFIEEMATFFRDNLEPERHLTVEYSNEVWNWIFGQTQWLNLHGCEMTGTDWPEGVVPYIQNCLDIWTDVFSDEMDRITRVAGVHTAWQDVSNRMVNNLEPGTVDAISPTYYFGFSDEGYTVLNELGDQASTSDVAFYAREGMEETKQFLQTQKTELADALGVSMVFYEGGQHLTPDPFGEEPTYAQALLDIQRDTAMYNMYNEWHAFLQTLQSGDEPLLLMNFSFVGHRSARFGSWGILETMSQDLDVVPAPKYDAILEAINGCEETASGIESELEGVFTLVPNPATDHIHLACNFIDGELNIFDAQGRIVFQDRIDAEAVYIDVSHLPSGMYLVQLQNASETRQRKLVVGR